MSFKFISLADSGLPGGKDVKLERIIIRVGGTQGEIDAVLHIRFMKMHQDSEWTG